MRLILILFISLISFEIKSFEKKQSFCDFNVNEYIHELRNSNYVEEIKVNVNDYKKWTINNLRILTDFRENIRTEDKKRFKAKVTVKYKFGKCVYKAKIRQHGDWKDHINYNKNNVYIDQSINVRLSEGNILGITEFILFLPYTRNGNNEILTTLLLNEFNILAPRSFLFNTNINDNTSKMLFQEKIRKEFLEINNRKEGPILEGDEELIWSYGVDTDDTKFKAFESVSLGRLNNVNWSSRNNTNILNSQKALAKLQEIYLLYTSSMIDNDHNLILNYNLLSNYNSSLRDKWLIFDILLMSLTAEHAMRPHNRKFYWSVLYDGFEPIYYDGNSRIINICKSEIIDPNLMSLGDYDIRIINNFIDNDIFFKIQNKLEELKNNQNFINKINLEMNISKNILVDKINIILKNNKCLKNYFDKQEKINLIKYNKEKTKKSFYSRLESLKINYLTIDNLLNNNNLKNVENYLSCQDNNLCIFTEKSNNELIAKILSHKHKINNKFIFYIDSEEVDKRKIFNLEKINDLKINVYHTNDAEIIYDHSNRKIIINQLNNTSRVIFFNGILENLDIEFNGIEKTNLFEDTNIDLKNTFTGCITFENVEFKNVSIISKQGKCEDSINVVNSSGEINLIKSYNAFSDAIDFDFSNIIINKIIVEDAINDCLDLSYGKYEINYMKLEGCGDKALSIGESSELINEIVKISNSNFGISTKDSSYSNFNFVEIDNVNTCISSYNKKQEFDGAISKINNIKCNNFQLAYYYDEMSKIQIISEELSKDIKSK